jgi:hypothetical protein
MPMLAFLSIETTGAAVGLALQAVEILDDMARSKPVRSRGGGGGETALTQMALPSFRRRLAEAKSLAAAARALLASEARRLIHTVQEYAPQGRKLTQEEVLEYGLSVSRLTDMCVRAVDHCFVASGSPAGALLAGRSHAQYPQHLPHGPHGRALGRGALRVRLASSARSLRRGRGALAKRN